MRINKVWSLFLGIYVLIVLVLDFVVDKNVKYYIQNCSNIKNVYLLPYIFMTIVVLFALYELLKQKELTLKKYCICLGIVSLVFLFIQLVISWNIYFYTGWDVDKVVSSAILLSQGGMLQDNYFSMYPNNLFLTFIFSVVIRIGSFVGISNGYFLCTCIGVVCINIAIYLGSITFYYLSKSSGMSMVVYIMEVILIGCSPWMTIPYSDAIAILFVALILSAYVLPWGKKEKWITIVLVSSVGYMIKPTVAISLIAILIFESLKDLKNLKNQLKVLLVLAAFILGFKMLGMISYAGTGYIIDKEKSFSPFHYLMMGLNEETDGVFAQKDVFFSQNFGSYQERNHANLEVAIERVRDMGVKGYFEHLFHKCLIAYNDGTFAWGREGGFYKEILTKNIKAADLLRNIYYNKGEYYYIFVALEQTVWLGVLIGMLPCLFAKKSDDIAVIALSLLGISAFLLIFEVRARYLFLYSPWFVILGGMGYYKCFLYMEKHCLNNLLQKSKK